MFKLKKKLNLSLLDTNIFSVFFFFSKKRDLKQNLKNKIIIIIKQKYKHIKLYVCKYIHIYKHMYTYTFYISI